MSAQCMNSHGPHAHVYSYIDACLGLREASVRERASRQKLCLRESGCDKHLKLEFAQVKFGLPPELSRQPWTHTMAHCQRLEIFTSLCSSSFKSNEHTLEEAVPYWTALLYLQPLALKCNSTQIKGLSPHSAHMYTCLPGIGHPPSFLAPLTVSFIAACSSPTIGNGN
jgi:hypothetical protein